jgi:hypothetical protein
MAKEHGGLIACAALVVFCLTGVLGATVIDRLVIAVEHQVITELQLDEELRVTAFLNKKPIVRDRDARRAVADRLIQQLLVKREMDTSHYPAPDADDINQYLEQTREQFGNESKFEQMLASYDLTVSTLERHLTLQLTTLRFIELRFRPDVDISDSEIQSYYQREIAHKGGTPPTLEESKESIRKILIEERIDRALDAWMEENRKQVNIVYFDKTLY